MPEPEPTPENELDEVFAHLDRSAMAAPEIAKYAAAYQKAFLEVGFDPDQALTLTINQMNT